MHNRGVAAHSHTPRPSARLRGAPLALSQKEFALLRMLASEPVRVFTKDEAPRKGSSGPPTGRAASTGPRA
jgi:DNA-binding response OmpR family regulator